MASSALAPAVAGAEGWPWPLDLPDRQITGTFMEARSGRFHSGLDMRTAGRVGVVVRAPVSGRVVRVRASAEGYGRALYLRLDDGRTLVFAHLLAFSDRIRAPLVEAQWRRGRYAQDVSLSGGGLPVEAGEVLALSGATGVGAPHLHFELRDVASRPVNPVGLFDLPDDQAPEILALRVHPLRARARVEGRARREAVADGDSLRVTGPVGLAVAVRDRRPGNGFSLMPETVELRLDDEVVYRLRQEAFAFPQSGQMELEYEPDPEGGPRWLRLYRRRGNDLPSRAGPSGGRLQRADAGWHRLRVVATDHDGNAGEASVHLRWQPWKVEPPRRERSSATRSSKAAPSRLRVSMEETHLELLAEGAARPPWLALSTAPADPIEGWTAAGARQWSTGLAWSALPPRDWSLVDRDGRTRSGPHFYLRGGETSRLEWNTEDGRLVVEATAGGSFPGGAMRVESGPSEELPSTVGEPLLETVWTITKVGWVAREAVVLRWESAHPLPEHAGWVLVEDGDPRWLESRLEGDILVAEGLDAGQLHLVRDGEPPWIGAPRQRGRPLDGILPRRSPAERRVAEGLHLPAWPAVDVPVDDTTSGIAEEGVEGEVDGRPWPVRLDPEAKTVSFDFHRDLPAGPHRLGLSVRDRSGRVRRAEWTFDFRDSDAGP